MPTARLARRVGEGESKGESQGESQGEGEGLASPPEGWRLGSPAAHLSRRARVRSARRGGALRAGVSVDALRVELALSPHQIVLERQVRL